MRTPVFLMAVATVACAQDFYNGQPGPGATQLDMYMSHANGETAGMIVPKLFLKKQHLLVAVPNGITDRGIVNKGVNAGYMHLPDKHGFAFIAGAGLFRDSTGRYGTLTPWLNMTKETGKLSIDAEVSYARDVRAHSNGYHAGGAVGYGVNDRVRIGGSWSANSGSKPSCRAIVRGEIKKNHDVWAQGYIGKNSIEGRLVLNGIERCLRRRR